MKKLILSTLIFSATFSCTKNEVATPQEKVETTSVPYRRLTTVPATDDDLKVELREVVEGRCPLIFNCIHGGSAKVTFKISDSRNASDVTVEYRNDSKTDFQGFKLGGKSYIIRVSEILPYPETNEQPELEDYQVRVSIEKK